MGNVHVTAWHLDVCLRTPLGASIRRRSQERDHELRHQHQNCGETKFGASPKLQ